MKYVGWKTILLALILTNGCAKLNGLSQVPGIDGSDGVSSVDSGGTSVASNSGSSSGNINFESTPPEIPVVEFRGSSE